MRPKSQYHHARIAAYIMLHCESLLVLRSSVRTLCAAGAGSLQEFCPHIYLVLCAAKLVVVLLQPMPCAQCSFQQRSSPMQRALLACPLADICFLNWQLPSTASVTACQLLLGHMPGSAAACRGGTYRAARQVLPGHVEHEGLPERGAAHPHAARGAAAPQRRLLQHHRLRGAPCGARNPVGHLLHALQLKKRDCSSQTKSKLAP